MAHCGGSAQAAVDHPAGAIASSAQEPEPDVVLAESWKGRRPQRAEAASPCGRGRLSGTPHRLGCRTAGIHRPGAPLARTLARLLSAVALTLPMTAALCGCSTSGDGCHGAAAALRTLAAQPLLAGPPAGATTPANYRGVGVTTGCDDGSGGKPWLHADRLYAYPGTRADVLGHYTRTAAAARWHREADPAPDAPPATVEGACWTTTSGGRHLLLTVDFRTNAFSPAPDPGRGITYEVSVGSRTDGAAGTCWH